MYALSNTKRKVVYALDVNAISFDSYAELLMTNKSDNFILKQGCPQDFFSTITIWLIEEEG